ncbi:HD domain-containing protein [Pendulispora brunnea]|uniref:HD domain-containing protein n=1 Tax=Pendulispora brunnea TaxID=2905690 RepID=A0ABZ2K7U5_9BACT
MAMRSVRDARDVLESLGATQRLLTHGLLVAEAAEALLATMRRLGVSVDEARVLAGAVLHDAGKIVHPSELDAPGASHEKAGESLLLAHGVDPHVAHMCVSHAAWADPSCTLEDRLVALADALWKGVRRPALEGLIIDEVARRLKADRWAPFMDLDTSFESVSDRGSERLARS